MIISWKLCKLNEKVEFFNEKRIPIESDIRESGQYPYYGATGIIDYVKDYIFDGEYVLLAEDGANILTRNSPIAYITEGRFWLNNHAHIMKMKIGTNYFLLQLLERINYEKFNSGTAQPKLNSQVVKNMVFNFPSEEEQSKTGSFFKQLDETITLHQRKLDKTLSVRTGILESLFPSRNDDTPVLRVTHFNSKWNQCNLGDCFDERNEKSQDGELLSVTIDRGVVLTSSLNRVDNSSDDKSNYKLVLPNDIAYNSMRMWQGASGVSNFKGIVSPAYTVLKPKPNISSHFFAYMFKLRHMIQMFEKHSQGLTSDTWNLKFPALSKINVRIPESLEEQTLIVNLLQSVDQTIEYHQNELVQLKQLKSVYLQKMFI